MMQASHKDDKKMIALIYFEMNNALYAVYNLTGWWLFVDGF